jgi:hypothetical protein
MFWLGMFIVFGGSRVATVNILILITWLSRSHTKPNYSTYAGDDHTRQDGNQEICR